MVSAATASLIAGSVGIEDSEAIAAFAGIEDSEVTAAFAGIEDSEVIAALAAIEDSEVTAASVEAINFTAVEDSKAAVDRMVAVASTAEAEVTEVAVANRD